MNDRQIKAFLEAARLLNFTKAAEKLYVPQSQVSRAIAALEKELGTVLFERENSRSITLSPAGEKYFSLFSRFETELGRTRESLREETHELRLGHNIGWNISGFLPEVVTRCRRIYDDFSVRIECLSFDNLMQKLQSGQLDAVISLEDYMKATSDVEYEVVTDVNRTIVYSERLFGVLVDSPEEMKGVTMFVAEDSRLREIISSIGFNLRPFNFIPDIEVVPNIETMFANVQNGRGVILADDWVDISGGPDIHSVSIDARSNIAIAWHEGEPPREVKLFADELRKYFADDTLPAVEK